MPSVTEQTVIHVLEMNPQKHSRQGACMIENMTFLGPEMGE